MNKAVTPKHHLSLLFSQFYPVFCGTDDGMSRGLTHDITPLVCGGCPMVTKHLMADERMFQTRQKVGGASDTTEDEPRHVCRWRFETWTMVPGPPLMLAVRPDFWSI